LVLSATHDLHTPSASPAGFVPNIDSGTIETLSLPNDVVATLNCNLGLLPYLPHLPRVGVTVECEGGKVELHNFVQPTIYHSIKVHKHDKTTRVEKVYKFTDAKMNGKGED
jgi:hypothetical protein